MAKKADKKQDKSAKKADKPSWNWLVKIGKEVILDPMNFFEEVPKEHGLKKALIYWGVVTLLASLMSLVYILPYSIMQVALKGGIAGFVSAPFIVAMIVVAYFLFFFIGLGMIFVSGAIYQFIFKLLNGKGGFHDTVRVLCYARTAQLFVIIPFAGFFVGIYHIVLLVIGFKQVHKLSWGMSVLGTLIPAIIMLFFVIVMIIIFVLFIFGLIIANIGG